MSVQDDQTLLHRADTVVRPALEAMVASGSTPGVTYALLRGEAVHVTTFGKSQTRPEPRALRPHMFYDLASLTKVVGTTPLFLRALAEGALALDQPIQTVLPEFSAPHVTFRMAMTHTSGLDGYIPNRDLLPAAELQHALLTQLHETAATGREVVYRDVNLLLVGWALEKIYGAPVQALIERDVLQNFGMKTATFAPERELSVPTSFDVEHGLRQGVVHDPKSAILRTHSGAAGMFATIDALVRYGQVTFGLAPESLLPADWARYLQADFAHGLGRSVGFDLRYAPGDQVPWLYHTGYTGTFMLLNPTTATGLIVLANRVHPVVHPDFLKQRDKLLQAYLHAVVSG